MVDCACEKNASRILQKSSIKQSLNRLHKYTVHFYDGLSLGALPEPHGACGLYKDFTLCATFARNMFCILLQFLTLLNKFSQVSSCDSIYLRDNVCTHDRDIISPMSPWRLIKEWIKKCKKNPSIQTEKP
jgi:hypothetical protein